MDDLRWKINEVEIDFKKKDEFSLLAAGSSCTCVPKVSNILYKDLAYVS